MAIAVAVTSIPVISKIFADLNILNTRFARLVLGVAVLEDIVLWAALAIATAMAGKAVLHPSDMAWHLGATVMFFGLGLTLIPRAVKRFNKSEINILARTSPVAYVMAVLFGYCAVAGALQVSMVFAAFLAGFAVVHKKRHLFDESLDAIRKVSFAVFIPIYFAIVGLKLDLVKGSSFKMLLLFLTGTCLIKVLSVTLGARLAGFRGLDVVNLALATNARGGPGIVLASVAYDAGIINAHLLHHAGDRRRVDVADRGRVAGVCDAQGMAVTFLGSQHRGCAGRGSCQQPVASSQLVLPVVNPDLCGLGSCA